MTARAPANERNRAMTTLLDVCRLSPDEALAVADWAARALVDATLEDRS